MQVQLLAVLCPKQVDDFMHAADLFEPSKRLVEVDRSGRPQHQIFTLTLNHDRPDYPHLVEVLKNAIVQEGSKRVLACFAPGQPGAWRDSTCTHVSTGTQFMLLDTLLASLGFSFEDRNQAKS